MSMSYYLEKRQFFQPSCPDGGSWYACASGSKFVGCCTNDPCAEGCAEGNVRAGTYDPTHYGNIPAFSCAAGGDFYTCRDTDPPFLGCCKDNPCVDGCAQEDLANGYLERPAQFSIYEATGAASTSRASQTSSATSTSVSTASGTATAPADSGSDGENNRVAIAGGAAGGGVALLLLLIGLAVFCVRRRKKQRKLEAEKGASETSDAPPNYSSPQSPYEAYHSGGHASELAGSDQKDARFSELPAEARTHELGANTYNPALAPQSEPAELESPWPSPNPSSQRSPLSADFKHSQVSPELGGGFSPLKDDRR